MELSLAEEIIELAINYNDGNRSLDDSIEYAEEIEKDYVKAISVTRCSTQLKYKEVDTFEDWLIANGYKPYNVYLYEKGTSLMHKIQLKEMYKDYLNL